MSDNHELAEELMQTMFALWSEKDAVNQLAKILDAHDARVRHEALEEYDAAIRALANSSAPASANEAQRRSFAFGNTSIENPQITREMVDREAERMRCPTCDGSGSDHNTTFTCPTCDGLGFGIYNFDHIACPTCGGSGKRPQ